MADAGLQRQAMATYTVAMETQRHHPSLTLRFSTPSSSFLQADFHLSVTLAAPSGNLLDLKTLVLFGVGAILLRGAACRINDLLDRDFDRQVERTKLCPIASGAVTPVQGLNFFGFQSVLWLELLLQFNQLSQVLGALFLLLVGIYPLFKRWTYWPQAFLGVAISWGSLQGWATVRGSIETPVIVPLYVAAICWTLVYDTIYAHQDKDDDVKVGVKSTALHFGDRSRSWLGDFGMGTLSLLLLAGNRGGLEKDKIMFRKIMKPLLPIVYEKHGGPFYAGVLSVAAYLFWQICTIDLDDRADCNAKFISNKWFGAVVFGGIVAGKLIL